MKVEEHLECFLQMTTSCTRDQLVDIFKRGRQQFADSFAVAAETKQAFVRDKKVFFNWLTMLGGNKGRREEIPKDTLVNLGETAKEHYSSYEASYVWFEMGKLLWNRHQTIQEERIQYIISKKQDH